VREVLNMNEQIVFTAALERDSSERAAFLEETCGPDRQLRERIEKLLRLHENAGGFLETLAVATDLTIDVPTTAERPGQTIGRYKLLELIGEGGFGVVWMAEQREPVQRKVALKILKAGMDTRQVVARFEAER
jgi:eukaryotic-like serine/threonine-protein kinase